MWPGNERGGPDPALEEPGALTKDALCREGWGEPTPCPPPRRFCRVWGGYFRVLLYLGRGRGMEKAALLKGAGV